MMTELNFMLLPVAQRSVVIICDVLGLSLHETCEVTGATLAATKAALHRGRSQLRRLAKDPDDGAAPVLDAEDQRRLRLYVDRLNARDFDAVRALTAEDIQLEVVSRTRMRRSACWTAPQKIRLDMSNRANTCDYVQTRKGGSR